MFSGCISCRVSAQYVQNILAALRLLSVAALCYLMPLAIQWRCGGLLFIHTGKTGGFYTKLPRCAISLQQHCLGMPAAAEQRPPQRLKGTEATAA